MLDASYETDHVDSDDMADILQLSLTEYHASQASSAAIAGPSQSKSVPPPAPEASNRQDALNKKISDIDADVLGYDKEIKYLEDLRASRMEEREVLFKELELIQSGGQGGKGKEKMLPEGINYHLDVFDWSQELKLRMKKVFGIDNFRLCQQGVCNANMDARDIVCVMPTGGGKSLTYQLPALLTPGCTLVISPLLSLITDQILHLREAGVEAAMLTGNTPREESSRIMASLCALASLKSNAGSPPNKDIKLCYVTPEKIAKSKAFLALLGKIATVGRLARIVVDEAHCVSQLGHDFRPDYAKLSILRQLFPRVPIMALSATCPPKVLDDLITNLRLNEVVDGSSAATIGTVYFTSPLYRKNLHYCVLPKHSSAPRVIRDMTNYILQHHPNESGIVYCLTKKDAETVASGLNNQSNGKIKTGVYHSEVKDGHKEDLHLKWRLGSIKVVCATIAFGLGIDKGDVRFVLHHSISKSMDGFYQESGRAGRDGKDADCVLYYRPQDATRLSSIICGELDGQQKLHDMLCFAQDMQECRKVHFAKYFSASSHTSTSSWSTEDSDALARCGHCDNCTRPPETVDHKDVTVVAWQIVKIADAVRRSGGRLTVNKLADFVRGSGGGTLEVSGEGGGWKTKETVDIDLEAVAGGKVRLTRDDTETLLVHLLISNYLAESFHQTSYSVNVYIIPGRQAPRLTRLTREQVENGGAPTIICSFRNFVFKGKSDIKKASASNTHKANGDTNGKASKNNGASKSARRRGKKRQEVIESEGVAEDEDEEEEEDEDLDIGFFASRHRGKGRATKPSRKRERSIEILDSDDSDGGDWAYSMRSPNQKRHRKSTMSNGSPSKGKEIEVVVLSD